MKLTTALLALLAFFLLTGSPAKAQSPGVIVTDGTEIVNEHQDTILDQVNKALKSLAIDMEKASGLQTSIQNDLKQQQKLSWGINGITDAAPITPPPAPDKDTTAANLYTLNHTQYGQLQQAAAEFDDEGYSRVALIQQDSVTVRTQAQSATTQTEVDAATAQAKNLQNSATVLFAQALADRAAERAARAEKKAEQDAKNRNIAQGLIQ